MQIWRLSSFQSESALIALLKDQADPKLTQVLAMDDLVQELKAQTPSVVAYVTREGTISQLVAIVLKETTVETPKHYAVAVEVLSSDIKPVSDAVVAVLARLLAVLDKTGDAVDTTVVTAVCRVVVAVMQKRFESVVETCRENKESVRQLVANLDKYPVVELLLKMVSNEEIYDNTPALDWLAEANLIKALLGCLSVDRSHDVHFGVVDIWLSILEKYKEAPNALMAQMYTKDSVDALARQMFQKNLERPCLLLLTGLISAILPPEPWAPVLMPSMHAIEGMMPKFAVSRPERASGNYEPVPIPKQEFFEALRTKLFGILDMLGRDTRYTVTNTAGIIETPLGLIRLNVVNFFASVVRIDDQEIASKICEIAVIPRAIGLMAKFPHCSILHGMVVKIVRGALSSNFPELHAQVISEADFAQKILDTYERHTELRNDKKNGVQYMGHYLILAQALQETAERSPSAASQLNQVSGWKNFVNGPLKEIVDAQKKRLGEKARRDSDMDNITEESLKVAMRRIMGDNTATATPGSAGSAPGLHQHRVSGTTDIASEARILPFAARASVASGDGLGLEKRAISSADDSDSDSDTDTDTDSDDDDDDDDDDDEDGDDPRIVSNPNSGSGESSAKTADEEADGFAALEKRNSVGSAPAPSPEVLSRQSDAQAVQPSEAQASTPSQQSSQQQPQQQPAQPSQQAQQPQQQSQQQQPQQLGSAEADWADFKNAPAADGDGGGGDWAKFE